MTAASKQQGMIAALRIGERVELAARDIRTARETLAYTMLTARAVTHQASMAGISEVQIARTLGVNRQTVRRWLGKGR